MTVLAYLISTSNAVAALIMLYTLLQDEARALPISQRLTIAIASAALAMSAGIVFGVPRPAEWRGWIIAKDVVISAAGAIYVIAWLLTRKIE